MNEPVPSLSELLQPIPGPDPSGEDTRYTGLYDSIREARREEPDLPQGDWRRERKTADWSAVTRLCTEALTYRTKDLQVAAWLTEALVHQNGFPGLLSGLLLLRGLVDQFWPTVYPRSEEDELEFRAAPLEWVGSRLDDAVRSVPLPLGATDWIGLAGRCLREVEGSLAALSQLDTICALRFEGAPPKFDWLRAALKAIESRLRPFVTRMEEADDFCAPSMIAARRSVPTVDRVHFTVTAPAALRPAHAALVTLWAHLESQRAEVMARARQQREADSLGMMSASKGPLRVARGAMLTVRLEVAGARIEDPEDSVLWDGEIGCANFLVTASANSENQGLCARALLYLSGVQIAKVQFVLQVGAASPDGIVPTTETRVRKAFASYSSADRDEVLGRLQGIRKAAPYLDIFFDVLTLRSGQQWETEIERMIPASDIFYLFWSLNARNSSWVEREWRTALGAGKPNFIDPVPLQPPDEAPPPPELASLHFNDWMLAFQRRRRSLKEIESGNTGNPV